MQRNEFMLIRHSYDDHSYIDGRNNTNLTSNGIEIAKNAVTNIIPKLEKDKIIIRHSSKIRAKETSEIIAEELMKNGFQCEIIEEPGLTELAQGTFDFGEMEHKDRVNYLQSCWDDFESCRKNGNLEHHFGEFKDDGVLLIPGECHREWSNRVARSTLNILDDLENDCQSISVTHRGAILELMKIVEMANELIDFDDVEQYETIMMNYCQDYILHINDIDNAKKLICEYIDERSI